MHSTRNRTTSTGHHRLVLFFELYRKHSSITVLFKELSTFKTAFKNFVAALGRTYCSVEPGSVVPVGRTNLPLGSQQQRVLKNVIFYFASTFLAMSVPSVEDEQLRQNAGQWLKSSQEGLVKNADYVLNSARIRTEVEASKEHVRLARTSIPCLNVATALEISRMGRAEVNLLEFETMVSTRCFSFATSLSRPFTT